MDAFTVNLLGAFARGLCDLQDAAMASAGLPPAELSALLAAHTRPGSTVSELAAATGLTHSGTVRVVDRLSRDGYVERRTGRDRRTAAIHPSREGRRLARQALELRARALAGALSGLTRSELAALRRLVTRPLAGLPATRADAWRICRLCDHGVCDGGRCPVGGALP